MFPATGWLQIHILAVTHQIQLVVIRYLVSLLFDARPTALERLGGVGGDEVILHGAVYVFLRVARGHTMVTLHVFLYTIEVWDLLLLADECDGLYQVLRVGHRRMATFGCSHQYHNEAVDKLHKI